MGLMKYYDPVTKKRVPIKAGSLVNDVGAPNEVTPDGVKAIKDNVDGHVANKSNPHATTKAHVGLGNVDNVKQASKAEFDALNNNLGTHLADKVSDGELHGFRLSSDKKLEYYNGADWVGVKGGGYPVNIVKNVSAKEDDMKVELMWEDPDDVVIDSVTVAEWNHTKVMRKIGSYPLHEEDGELVVSNGVRNAYKTNPYIDTGLQNGTTYYYSMFPTTNEEIVTMSEVSRVSVIPIGQRIYGVEIDESNSNPETSVVYTDDAVGFTSATGNNGAFSWGSWENIIKDEFKIRPCVLNNPAKTVNYYLNYDNYNLKVTGGASNLTGTDGDVMIEFGTDIYTKWTVLGSKHKIQFSIKPFEGATKNAFETENGYNQFAYYPLLLTQKLFQIIFKNRDGQTALGRGYVDANAGYATTGNTNSKGFIYGETTGKQQMKFLGIEDYWGNKHQWIDGLVTDASYNILIGNGAFNDAGSGYISHPSGVSAGTTGYIDTVQGGNDKGFIIKSKAGSETTHYCDNGALLSTGQVARFGGHLLVGSDAGFAQLQLNNLTSTAGAVTGARLMCVSNSKLYIGAYLGTTQSGKLRSVSGTTPSGDKTISVFRSEAKANNV